MAGDGWLMVSHVPAVQVGEGTVTPVQALKGT
jgi:hypothetical protein